MGDQNASLWRARSGGGDQAADRSGYLASYLASDRGLAVVLPRCGDGVRPVELNTRGRYAVMAIADLARLSVATGSVPLSVVAERQLISLAYLEQLFAKLRRAELVESVRGRAGGYRLARAAADITIADVMAAVAERTDMTRCGVEAGEPCLGGKRCLTHDLWDALGDHIDQFLSSVTLQQLIEGRVPRRAPPLTAPAALFAGGLVAR